MFILQKGNVEKQTESEVKKEALLRQGFKLYEPPEEQPKAKSVSQMNKEELLAACAAVGIIPPDGATVEQLKELLKSKG